MTEDNKTRNQLLEEIKADEEMVKKTNKVIEILESFKTQAPAEDMVCTILKIQALAQETKF